MSVRGVPHRERTNSTRREPRTAGQTFCTVANQGGVADSDGGARGHG